MWCRDYVIDFSSVFLSGEGKGFYKDFSSVFKVLYCCIVPHCLFIFYFTFLYLFRFERKMELYSSLTPMFIHQEETQEGKTSMMVDVHLFFVWKHSILPP